LGTPRTRFGTGAHLFIIAHIVAVSGASHTNHRASAAGVLMQGRVAQHKIRAGGANLHTILHQRQMLGRNMVPALMQAVIDRFETDLMAIGTMLDTLPHR